MLFILNQRTMVVVGKYRSRRRKGGNILAAVHKNRIVKAVENVKQAVHHPFDHEPMAILKSVDKHIRSEPEHAVHILNQVAKDVSNIDPNAMNPMHNFTSEFPNFSGPDPYAFARSIRQSLGTLNNHTRTTTKWEETFSKMGFQQLNHSQTS